MIRMVTNHELKTHPEYFQEVWEGNKPFEIRKDNRGYEKYDALTLREWDPDTQEYTGRAIYVPAITYIFSGGAFGVVSGTVVLGFDPNRIERHNSHINAANPVRLYKDGDQWCALLGENLQEGVAGFGVTPVEAVENLMLTEELK